MWCGCIYVQIFTKYNLIIIENDDDDDDDAKKGSFLPFSWFGFGLIISKNAMCLWFCHFTIEIVIFSNHLSLRMHYFCYTNIFTFVCYKCYTKHLDMQMSFRSFILYFYSISLFFSSLFVTISYANNIFV